MLGEKRPDSLILVDGYMTEHELRFLVLATEDKEGVEIGSWFGRSTVNIIQRCKSLVCVDPFCGTPSLRCELMDLKKEGKFPKDIFEENLRKFNHRNTPVRLLAMPSREAVGLIEENQKFDFVFVDGSHEYEDVRDDILLWQSHVRSGGLMMGHDYKVQGAGNRPGVDKAVDEIFPILDGVCIHIWWKYV